jgi:hypothetical protein
MLPRNKITRILPAVGLVVLLAVVYLLSMAPGLTWANEGSDGGDLIVAAHSGGVAHPTGYPTYILLAQLFQLIPVCSLAFRTNLMSAVLTIVAALIIYYLKVRHSSPVRDYAWIAGMASAIAFGLAPLIWSQAVVTEVYALHSLFVVFILFLSTNGVDGPFSRKWRYRLLGLFSGLALGNHLTSLLLLPVLGASIITRNPDTVTGSQWKNKWRVDENAAFQILPWLGVGLLVYLALPLRAMSHPPVNWGNPVDLHGLFWLVSGKLYQAHLFDINASSLVGRIQAVASLTLDQFGVLGLILGFVGLFVFFKPGRLNASMLWISASSVIFAIGYSTADAVMYLIPAFLCFAIWIGIGVDGLMEVLSKYLRKYTYLLGLASLTIVLVHGLNAWSAVDASEDFRAESFGNSVLTTAPYKAIVFAKGDQAVFTLWYYQYGLSERPDLYIVATELLPYEWYQQVLRDTYSDLEIPFPSPFSQVVVAANTGHPVCYVEYLQGARIDCSPAEDMPGP